MSLGFDDGIEINTEGRLRKLALADGLYVVGEGICIPVASAEEAEAVIAEETAARGKPEA